MQRDGALGTTVTRSLRDVIRGYEFKAIVEERSPYRLTRSYLTSTHLQWHLGDTSLFEHARRKEHTDIGATVCNKSYRNQPLAK